MLTIYLERSLILFLSCNVSPMRIDSRCYVDHSTDIDLEKNDANVIVI